MPRELISISVDPADFKQVMQKVHEMAVEDESNHSEILRNALFEHFGINPKGKYVRRNFVRACM